MNRSKNNFNKTIEVEFRDLLNNLINSSRRSFHLFTIHRILSLGLLNDFSFKYQCSGVANKVDIVLDLKEFGEVVFSVDIATNYVTIPKKEHKGNMEKFIRGFDKTSEEKSRLYKVF